MLDTLTMTIMFMCVLCVRLAPVTASLRDGTDLRGELDQRVWGDALKALYAFTDARETPGGVTPVAR